MAVITEMCHHPTTILTSHHSTLHSVKFQHKATFYSDGKSATKMAKEIRRKLENMGRFLGISQYSFELV